MNLLSRRSLLAIVAVLDVALHARPHPVAAKVLAMRHKLPPRHLETMLQALVRAGILKGMRGPRGGYELARERRRITAGHIVRAVMGGEESDTPVPESAMVELFVAPMLREASEQFLQALDDVTLEELCRRVETSPRDMKERLADFTI